MTRPVPIDLSRHAHLVEGAAEFLRLWATPGGPITCFVNPRPLGPDPYLLGAALAEAVAHGARAYARATGIGEDEAAARIWAGVEAGRPAAEGSGTLDLTAAETLPPDDPIVPSATRKEP